MTHPERAESSDHPLDLWAASRDLWPAGTLAMWQGRPSVAPARVWWPEDDAAVEAVLRAAVEAGAPVVPYGEGSGVCGGASGMPGAWVVDLKRFHRIGAVDPETWTVEVEAGVNGQQLEDELARQGFTLGHSPSSIGCSTVGGWVAARSAGQFSSRYGVIEDMVVGLDGVAPGVGPFVVGVPSSRADGTPRVRLADELLPMIVGSEGTLAIITRARLKVRPLPATRWLRGYRVADVPTALRLMRKLMQGELWPSVVRLYDPVDTLVGGRTQPKRAHHGAPAWWRRWLEAIDALPAVRRRTLALPLALPGLLQALADRWAKGCLVIVGWEGDPEVVRAASEAGHAILMSEAEDLGPEPGERWFLSRHAVSYKLMPVFERGGFADTMEIAARWSVLPRAYEAVREAVRGHALVMAHMSHVYPEGGCIYFSFAGRGDPAVYERVWEAAQGAALASGATVTHHHGVGVMKAPWATAEVGAAVQGWSDAKKYLDPTSSLNPGRLFLVGEGADVPRGPALFVAPPEPEDGLCATRADGAGARWGTLGAVPVWAREAWQTGVVEVEATVGGSRVWLGRGPRSAAGPDLRGWAASEGQGVEARVSSDVTGEASPTTWMGVGSPPDPWGAAQALLRGDLRPAVCEVVEGELRVGFRGPAARAFGALAAARVPGGLREAPFEVRPHAVADLRPAPVGDDAPLQAVTSHYRLARVGWGSASSSAAQEDT